MRIVTPSLLITDDDRDLRETLRGAFEVTGIETLLAADGEEALAIVQRQSVHIVLMDMHMPRLSGIETIRRLKQVAHGMPMILMSAALDPQIESAAHQEQVFSVLPKPFSFTTIRSLVREALHRTYAWAG